MEDDVDWDIAIKDQLSLVAPLIRQITNSTDDRDLWPYGQQWDLLWLGHCGDLIPQDENEILAIEDRTLPPTSTYRENYGEYVDFPRFTRMIYMSVTPVCTFAYGVTAASATKIIQLISVGGETSITNKLRILCQQSKLRCVTVNPELFHHHKSAGQLSSDIASIEGWKDADIPAGRDFTANIRYSARCNSRSSQLVSCRNEFYYEI